MGSPGDLDQRITLQAYTSVADGAGGVTRTLADLPSVPTVWAHVRPVRGSERYEEERTNASGLYLFTIRYRTDVDELGVIDWRGELYNIRTVKRTSQRDLYTVIEAERGVPA